MSWPESWVSVKAVVIENIQENMQIMGGDLERESEVLRDFCGNEFTFWTVNEGSRGDFS